MKGTIRVRVSYDDAARGEPWAPRTWPVLSLHRDFTLVDRDSADSPTGDELHAMRDRASTLAQGAFTVATGFISSEGAAWLAPSQKTFSPVLVDEKAGTRTPLPVEPGVIVTLGKGQHIEWVAE